MKLNRFLCISVASIFFLQINGFCQTDCLNRLNADNLVLNGDFEGTVQGIISDYTQGTSGPGSWKISEPVLSGSMRPATVNGQPGDHTKGNTSGHYMIIDVDASENSNGSLKRGWYTTVSVQPNTTYFFSVWIANINSRNRNPSQLKFYIGNTDISNGTVITPPGVEVTDETLADHSWGQFYTSWNSGSTSGNIEISMKNILLTATGNDLALDDISFSTSCKWVNQLEKSHFPDKVSVCNGQPAVLNSGITGTTASDKFTWTKNTPGGTIVANTQTYTVPANTFDRYYLCYIINNCARLDTVQIVNEPIIVNPVIESPAQCGINGTIAIPRLMPLTDYTVTYTYQNSPVTVQTKSNNSGQILIAGKKGLYSELGLSANGCTSIKTNVTLNDPAGLTLNLGDISYGPKSSCLSTWNVKLYGVESDVSYPVTINRKGNISNINIQSNSSSSPYIQLEDMEVGLYMFSVTDPETNCKSNDLSLDLIYIPFTFLASANNPVIIGGEGSISFSKLSPLNIYDVNYTYNGTPMTINKTASNSGTFEITGKSGVYSSLYLSKNGCNSLDTNIILKDPVITGLSEREKAESFFFCYPNPSQGFVTIKTSSFSDITVKIFNSLGIFVEERKILANTGEEILNLSSLISGTYFLHVTGDEKSAFYNIVITR